MPGLMEHLQRKKSPDGMADSAQYLIVASGMVITWGRNLENGAVIMDLWPQKGRYTPGRSRTIFPTSEWQR